MEIEIKKGECLILLSKPESGKTSLIQSIIGNLNILSGEIRYGGRLGYAPQKLWFRKESVRNNILFGQALD